MDTETNPEANGKVLFRVTTCLAILIAATFMMVALIKMKKPPAEVPLVERMVRVETVVVKTEAVQVVLDGFGQVTTPNKVFIAAEIPGRIIAVHPRLDQGEIIEQNKLLFKIDPSDYLAVRDGAVAEVERLGKNIILLEKQMETDLQRLAAIERNRDLAKTEHERQQKLFQEHEIGSLSDVEKLEQVYNNAQDQAARLAGALALYPVQIEEVKSGLAAAKARLENAQTNLSRCEVKAPFTGRITQVRAEVGQFVSPGQQVLVMADDSVLEIQVAIDSAEARDWLRYKKDSGGGWFTGIEQVVCDIRWTEDKSRSWKGVLHRVVSFDPDTRTITVAVRIGASQGTVKESAGLPLVDGMFCSVTIPGRTMEKVFRLPRWAVSFKNTVYLAVDNRLKTVPVEVVRSRGEETFVRGGIKEGDQVIITRLVEPLENAFLEILNNNETAGDKNGLGEKP